MSVNDPQIEGICPECASETSFSKSDTPGPYYICSICEEEVRVQEIETP